MSTLFAIIIKPLPYYVAVFSKPQTEVATCNLEAMTETTHMKLL